MATSAGEVEVKLSLNADDFKAALTSGGNQLNNFGGVLQSFATKLAAAFSFAAVADFFKESIAAYAENQLAVTRLVAALNNQGTATRAVVDQLTQLSEALQNETGTSKNAILAAETLLTTFGVQASLMPKVIQATLDLSAATGVDLQRASLLMGKAFEGQTSTLSRYGVLVSQHIPLNERFAAVLGQVEGRFGGAAQAQADTYTGKLNIMKQSFNDLQEQIGKFLSGPAGGFVKWLTDTIRSFTSFLSEVNNTGSFLRGLALIIGDVVIFAFENLAKIFVAFNTALLQMLTTLPLIGTKFLGLVAASQQMNATITQQATLWRALLAAQLTGETEKQEAALQTKKIVIEAQDLQSKAVADALNEDAKLRSKQAADAKAGYEEFVRGFMTTIGDMWKFASSMRDEFFQGMGDAFAKQVVEGKSFSEAMKNLFKNMAEQMISYIVQIIAKLMVMWALEQSTGFGGGVATGGSMFGAFATGGVVDEPSILLGLRSGSKTLVGEAGPEVVSPMSGGNQGMGSADGGKGGGGGNITVNISGQFIQGDSNSWNRLIREQIIPGIRRYTMANPTGPFNRKRGVV